MKARSVKGASFFNIAGLGFRNLSVVFNGILWSRTDAQIREVQSMNAFLETHQTMTNCKPAKLSYIRLVELERLVCNRKHHPLRQSGLAYGPGVKSGARVEFGAGAGLGRSREPVKPTMVVPAGPGPGIATKAGDFYRPGVQL